MAIAFDAQSQGTAAASTTLTVSHTVGAGANMVLLVAEHIVDNSAFSTPQYNGVGMTFLSTVGFGVATNGQWGVWIMVGPPSGAHNITIPNGTAGTMGMQAVSYSGVNQSTTPDAVGTPTSSSGGGAQTCPITTVATGAWTVAFGMGLASASPTLTAPTGTQRGTTLAVGTQDVLAAQDSNGIVAPGAHTSGWTGGGTSAVTDWLGSLSLAPAPVTFLPGQEQNNTYRQQLPS